MARTTRNASRISFTCGRRVSFFFGRHGGVSRRRGMRGFGGGFRMGLGVDAPWRRAGGLLRTGYGRGKARGGHAAVGMAAHEPADFRAQLENAAQGVGIPGGVQVFAEGAVGGEEPVLAQGAQGAAGGSGHREGAEQGQEQELQGRRNPGVQDRPRPGARCVGFARCGGLMGHHREVCLTQHRQTRKKDCVVGIFGWWGVL